MKIMNRWGLAAGLAAALALFGTAQAQSAAGGSTDTTTGRGDTGSPPPAGSSDQSTTGSSTERMGAPSGTPSSERATAMEQKVDKGLQEKLEKIHAAHQCELLMGQLGSRAQSADVKQFAEHMQEDHHKADQKLTQAAQSLGVSLEGKTFQKERDKAMKDMEKLQSKTGTDFDKEFMSRMVKLHEKDLKDVESAAKDARKANYTELASLLDQTRSGMKGHLDHAKQLRASVDRGGGEQMRQGRRPAGPGGPSGMSEPGRGGDTGGATPSGPSGAAGGMQPGTPSGGAAGTSSDQGSK